jgi:hypothetical protein
MEGNTMNKTLKTVATTLAVVCIAEKLYAQKRQIDNLKARNQRLGRWNDHYYDSLWKAVKLLDGEERRKFIRNFNEEVDFIKITNNM